MEEVAKKFSTSVLIVAARTMMSQTTWNAKVTTNGVRPRSRTLKSVQESLLDDLVYPSEIAAKRTKVSTDAHGKVTKVLTVTLSAKEPQTTERLSVFSQVAKEITGKGIKFTQEY